MSNIFLIADTHFSHANILDFKGKDGKACRPFSSVEEMDETMIENWNKVVGDRDKVYHLGDVAIHKRGLDALKRLNGTKILVKGNHDVYKLSQYTPYFKDIRGYHVLDRCIFSHIPIHPDSKGRFKANIHGHLHTNRVMKRNWFGWKVEDPFYTNVSVEQINYTPIAWEELKKGLKL